MNAARIDITSTIPALTAQQMREVDRLMISKFRIDLRCPHPPSGSAPQPRTSSTSSDEWAPR